MDSEPDIVKENRQLMFTRFRIIKNLVVISFTFVLLFSAYDGLSMLQTTMNKKHGIGSASQAVVYTAFATGSLLLPKYTIKKLGCKMTLFIGTLLYLPYIAANVYPTWATMMSSAVLVGIGAAILYSAQSTYFNEAARLYCSLGDDCEEGKRALASKSGSRNFDLFVIENGINEKVSSLPGIKCDNDILNSHYFRKHMKDCIADSKCCNVKMVSINNHDLNTITNNIKIHQMEKIELNAQCDETGNTYKNQLTRTICLKKPVKYEQSKSDVDPLANIEHENSLNENIVFKKHSIYSKQGSINEITMNRIKKKMSLADEFLYTKSRSESIVQLCTRESVTARFFGGFGMMYFTTQVWSNLISYYVLNNDSEQNATLISNYSCGAGFCNSEFEVISDGTDEISASTRYLYIGINLALCIVSSLLVYVCLDPLDTLEEGVTFSLSHVMATFNQLKKKEQLLLIPLSMFSGMIQGFYTADFTKAYIHCAWGISYVGMVTVFYGLASGITSTISGSVVKYIGRIPVVIFGLALHFGIDVFLILWNTNTENHFMFYLAASLWGAKVSIFYCQIQAFYGLLFKNDEEAAFASYNFCSAIGWTITFSCSDYLCTTPKIYFLLFMSCMGVLGYLAADRSFKRRQTS